MAVVLDWLRADQPEALIQQVVETLRSGGVVAVPTEAGYVLAAHALLPQAIDSLTQISALAHQPLLLAVSGVEEVRIWASGLSRFAERLLQRTWPGSVQYLVPVTPETLFPETIQQAVLQGQRLPVYAPQHTAIQTTILHADFSLVLKETELLDPRAVEAVYGDSIPILVDAGILSGSPTTLVRLEKEHWMIERLGSVTEAELVRASAHWIVFICTGNTCRSPMAEAYCKHLLAQRLGCLVGDLPSRGYNIVSAGVAAYPGDGPSPEAVDVLRDQNIDLSGHRSQSINEQMLQSADRLVAMTRGHLMALLSRYAPAGQMQLLCGAEGDLEDPIGAGREVYQECAQTIQRHVDRLITEWITL